jgi:predicted transcriptional regulator
MNTITARISDDLNAALIKVAKQTKRSKGHIILKAIQNYVLELQEDIEDYNDAMEVLAQNNPRVLWTEVQRNRGFIGRLIFVAAYEPLNAKFNYITTC